MLLGEAVAYAAIFGLTLGAKALEIPMEINMILTSGKHAQDKGLGKGQDNRRT
jgi:hypothetical protein